MSGILQDNYWFSNEDSTLEIGNSLRFRGAQIMTRTQVAGDADVYTLSLWCKRGRLSSGAQGIISAYQDSTNETKLEFDPDELQFLNMNGGNTQISDTNALLRDPNAWYHFVAAIDTQASSNTDKAKLYINGELQTLNSVIANGLDTAFNVNGNTNIIGSNQGLEYFEGYLSSVYLIDGQKLSPTDFGEYNAQGVWVPKLYTGTFGTNGFYLDFSDPTDIGKDTSGNGNDFTATGFQFQDSTDNYLQGSDLVSDSPTNNYFHVNPLNRNGITGSIYNANTSFASGFNSVQHTGLQQIGPSAGGKYVLMAIGGGGPTSVRSTQFNFYATKPTTQGSGTLFFSGWYQNPTNNYFSLRIGSNTVRYKFLFSIAAQAEYVGYIAVVDELAGKYWLGYYLTSDFSTVNYVSPTDPVSDNPTANPDTGTSPTGTFTPGLSLYYDTGFYSNNVASGAVQGPYRQWEDFIPQIPNISSFTLFNNSDRLPATPIPNPSDHFDVVQESGSTVLSTLQSKFSTGIYIVKRTDQNNTNWQFTDSTQSGNSWLSPANTSGSYTTPGGTCAGYAWKVGSSTSNTNGTRASTVSVNQIAGVSIVRWTGSGGQNTVGHGLSQAPKWIIVKNVTSQSNNSVVWADPFTADEYILLSDSIPKASNSAFFGGVPTSTTFTVGSTSATNQLNNDLLAYCFHDVPGFCASGTYTGNNIADGPFVYCGFKPAMIIRKNIDGTGGAWAVQDRVRTGYNPVGSALYFDRDDASVNASKIDILSNGFKIRDTSVNNNVSGNRYIWIAWAEHPFGGSNVSPATAR